MDIPMVCLFHTAGLGRHRSIARGYKALAKLVILAVTMIFKKLLFIFFLYTICTPIFGQVREVEFNALKFKNISLKQGLSQSSVLCIFQDKEGFLWFGTRDGLNKYDGNAFKVYRYNFNDTTSLSDSFIKSIYQDANGNTWVGTRNGLNRYLPREDTFARIDIPRTDSASPNNEIWSIVGDDGDHLWLATNQGLGKLNIKNGTLKYYKHIEGDSTSIASNSIRALTKTKDGNLWVKTVQNVEFFDPKTETFVHYDYPGGSSKEKSENSVSTLFEDSKNNMWLGFKDGLAILDKKSNRFKFFNTHNNGHLITDEVRSISEDNLGKLWIGTYRGLYIMDSNLESVSYFAHDENNPNSLSQNSIYTIYEDSKGDIWIGTYAGGVNYYDRNYDLFKHFTVGTNNTKLNYKVVSSIVEDKDLNLWIGTEGGGINVFDKKAGTFKYYVHEEKNPNSLSANNIKSMIRDREGNFWIGTHDGGLNFLDPREYPFKFKKYKNIPDDSSSISNNRVISLLQDHKNNVWIGTSGGGINVLDTRTNTISRIQDTEKIIGNIIYTISEDPDENAVLVGGDKGLGKIDITTKQIYPILFRKNNREDSASHAVLCTYMDQNKNLWIGTEGDGLYCYKGPEKSTHYGVSDGLPSDVVFGIVPDDRNNVWLSTFHGLSRMNLKTYQFKNFDESDGLQGDEFNYGAYLRNEQGELLFGGTNGFNIFDPHKIIENTFIPPVAITSFKVNNTPFLHVTDSTGTIELKYDQNVFNFDFVALSYTQPNKNQYAYMLEGFDMEWNYIGNKKSATYTNLDPGSYHFRVKASNNDGLWNHQGASIVIRILPAIWKTWWAYLIYTILLVSIFFMLRKFYLERILERIELKRERVEKERIEEVNKMKLQLFTNISHDFRTPLTLIIGPLERMIKAGDGNSFIQRQHETMHRNASVLMQLINQLLDFRKAESGKMQLAAYENNIVSYVKEVKLAFEELARSRNIEFRLISTQDNIPVWFDKIMLNKILFNLLSNAFKFTPDNGQILVEIDVDKNPKKRMRAGWDKLKIQDSGKGISKKNIDFIFDRFYQIGERFGTGIGLTLTKSLVELHHGSIKVKSTEKKGTSFSVMLPLGKDHFGPDQIFESDVETTETDFYQLERSTYIEEKEETTTNVIFDESLPTILVVEDNAEVRSFIKGIFQDTYNIFESPDGKKAIKITKTTSIDLIISDVMMPVMDGIQLCDEIKSNIRTSHIPVILLTARTSEEYQRSGYKTGADAYITKPFDADILEIRVNNLIRSRQLLIKKFKNDIILRPKELTTTSADEEFLQKAINFVEENISDSEFTVHSLIDQMNMSRSALYRKLKSLTGQSLTEFIRIIKLKRAAQLILKTQMTISEIAFELGFNDQKHFRQSFKQQFHKSPSKYRAENSGDIV